MLKVNFFMWTDYLDKILTLDHSKKRGWKLANRCVMCMIEEDTVNHLFNHCPMVCQVWQFFLLQLKVSWVFPSSFRSLIARWQIREFEGIPSSIWPYFPWVICWGIWKERNR